MLAQSVPCDDVSSATVQAIRVASRVEVTGNDEPGVKRGESVQQVGQLFGKCWCDSVRRPIDADDNERRKLPHPPEISCTQFSLSIMGHDVPDDGDTEINWFLIVDYGLL